MALQTSSTRTRSVPNPPPTTIEALKARVAELEAQLAERDGRLIHFPDFTQASEVHACSVIGILPQFRAGEGVVGNKRKQRVMSLMINLKREHAITADGSHVENYADVFRYLIDQVRIGTGDANPSAAIQKS